MGHCAAGADAPLPDDGVPRVQQVVRPLRLQVSGGGGGGGDGEQPVPSTARLQSPPCFPPNQLIPRNSRTSRRAPQPPPPPPQGGRDPAAPGHLRRAGGHVRLARAPGGGADAPARLPQRPGLQVLPQHAVRAPPLPADVHARAGRGARGEGSCVVWRLHRQAFCLSGSRSCDPRPLLPRNLATSNPPNPTARQLIGHVPMLADPDFGAMVQAIGIASLGADEKTIWHLTKCYCEFLAGRAGSGCADLLT